MTDRDQQGIRSASLDAGHEMSDVAAGPLLKAGIGIAALVVFSFVAVVVFYKVLEYYQPLLQDVPHPLHRVRAEPFPEPSLEVDGPRLRRVLQAEENKVLTEYAWVDKEQGTVRLPVARAMALLAERGLPVPRAKASATAAAPVGDLVVTRMDLNPKTLAALTPTSLSIETDPFYKAKNSRFEGYAFDKVLAQIPGLSGIERGRHSLRFVCADGYRTTFPFEAVENGHGLLATALLDHKDKTGDAWAPKLRGKSEQTPAPYYLVWAGETDLKARPWPYQLVSIEVLVDDALAAALEPPPEAGAEAGYQLFRTYCLACHTVNLQGGKMGPELNVPKNIFEYRDGDLVRAFVRNPQSFRAASLMPPQMISNDKIEAIFVYLRAMEKRKVCASAAECAALVEAALVPSNP
jgi:mono/diheme cytochrome c family protein